MKTEINEYLIMPDQGFFVASMPSSRPADYYLGYMEGCVFLDFNNCAGDKVSLIRISFDGYGCCELEERPIPLNRNDSRRFREIIQTNIEEQIEMLGIVKRAIKLNENSIWADALKEYNLI